MRPASPTSPASRSMRRAACSPAPSPTASSTAFRPRTRPSSSTTPACRRSARSCRMPDGTVYAAALGGSVAKRAQSAAQAAQGAAGTGAVHRHHDHHHRRSAGRTRRRIKPPEPASRRRRRSVTPRRRSARSSLRSRTSSGVEKSALYRINPDNTVETLWSSKEENVYDVLALERQILFSTDENGRIYGLSPDRRVTLVAQTNEGETTRLLPSRPFRARRHRQHGPHLPARRKAGRHRFLRSAAARFRDRLALGQPELARRSSRRAARSRFRTRSGNSAKPDRTWSEWSEPLTNPGRFPHHQPQRALHRMEGRDDRHRRRHAHPEQRHPRLPAAEFAAGGQEHQRDHAGRAHHAGGKAAAASSSAAYSVTVTDTGDVTTSAPARPRRRCRAPPRSRSRSPGSPKIPITTGSSTTSTSAAKTPPSGCC